MRTYQACLWVIVASVMVTSPGCQCRFSTANIRSVKLAKDADGEQETAVFAPSDTVYLLAEVANAPDDTTVRCVWTLVEAEGAEANKVIGEKELTSGSATYTFNLSPAPSLAVGEYKIDLYLNGKLDQTLTFTVEAPAATGPPRLENVTLAKDKDGEKPTTVFAPTDTFFCVLKLTDAPAGTVVKSVWTAVEAEGVEGSQKIDEAEVTTGSAPLHFNLKGAQPWPPGTYKVDLYLNGTLDQTLQFTVAAPPAG